MACLTRTTQHCVTCRKGNASFCCTGCNAYFCLRCLRNHRDELSTHFDSIIDQHNQLRYSYEHPEVVQKHRLFSQINTWEENAISTIKQAATITRDKLQQLIDDTKARTNAWLNELSEQLRMAFKEAEYTEIDLAHWNKQLNQMRQEWQRSLHIDIVTDYDVSPIYLIKLKMMKEELVTQSQVTSTRSNDSSDNISTSNKYSLTPQLNVQSLHEQKNDQIEIKYENSLDPTENNNLILLQISTPNASQLPDALHKLTDGHLTLINKTSAWLAQLKQSKQSTLVIDMFRLSLKEQDDLLNDISNLTSIRSVYIRGTPPEADDDRQYFFSKYSIIKAMFENEQSLIAQWAMDTANEYKQIGDMHIGKGEKDLAQKYFAEGVGLYKRLSTYLNKKRHNT